MTIGLMVDWWEVLVYLILIVGALVYACLEGFVILLLGRFLSRLFSKKSSQAVPQTIPPKRIRQIKNRLERIYMAFKKGDYAAAYGQFEDSQITETEFRQEIQAYLAKFQLNRLRLPDFREKEPDLDISALSKREYEVELSLTDSRLDDFSSLNLLCQVRFKGETIQRIELLEAGYE